MSPFRRLFAVLLALVLTLPSVAQQKEPALVEQIDVSIVNVDVVVTDKQGKYVSGLKAEDFELLENGAVRPIANFYESVAAGAPGAAPAVMTNVSAPAAPATAARANPRRMIFFVDNYSLTTERRARLIEQMKQFAQATMREGDEAMVASYNRSLTIRTPFTTDPVKIDDGFAAVLTEAPMGDLLRNDAARTELAIAQGKEFNERFNMARVYATERSAELRRCLDSMRQLMHTIAGVEGKKALVFASESFPLFPGREMFETIDRLTPQYEMDKIAVRPPSGAVPPEPTNPRPAGGEKYGRALSGSSARTGFKSAVLEAKVFDAHREIETFAKAANSDGVTLYPLHGGIAAAGGEETSAQNARSGRSSQTAFSTRANSEQAMQLVADLTGGIASLKSGNYQEAFARIRRDLDSYYSLGFRATGGAAGDRDLEVRLKNRRGLQVRARRSYAAKTSTTAIGERVVANLFARPSNNDLQILVQASNPIPQGNGKFKVPLQVRVPLDGLMLQSGEADTYTGRFDVFVVAANPNGTMSDVIRKSETVKLGADAYRNAKGKYHTYAMTLLMEQGSRVSVGVVDSVTQASGYGRYEVDEME